jgi:hypothetical protein
MTTKHRYLQGLPFMSDNTKFLPALMPRINEIASYYPPKSFYDKLKDFVHEH